MCDWGKSGFPAMKRAAQEQAELLVKKALDLLNSNNAKIAKESLEKASRLDPNATRADFLLGVLYALVGRSYSDAHAHFMECVRREPQDVCTLNNLALVELMLNNHQAALNHLREAVAVDPTVPEIAHNIRRVLTETGQHNIVMPGNLESSFSGLYGELIRTGATEQKISKGWLYLPPVMARMDYRDPEEPNPPEEPPSDPKTNPGHPSVPGKSPAAKPGHPIVPKKPPGPSSGVITSGGTGFVVYPHYVLTNQHVVKGHRTVLVTDPTDPASKRLSAIVLGQSEDPDLAILRCDDLEAPPVGINPRLPGRGSDIMILGFPEFFRIGTGLKSTRGTIVGLPEPDTDNMCLWDATTNHGNSGGPVCDNTGRVVAVVRVGYNLMGKLGGGIPSEQVVPFLKNYIPTLEPIESGTKLEWPDVDTLVSKSTVLIQCSSDRERQVMIPDGDEDSFQATVASGIKGTTRQKSKTVRPGEGCIEDDGCLACHGTGRARCPDCQNGTVASTERVVKYREPVTGTTIYEDKKTRVRCRTCGGTGQVSCPVCGGSGLER